MNWIIWVTSAESVIVRLNASWTAYDILRISKIHKVERKIPGIGDNNNVRQMNSSA
jgi:hypothetical protein